MDIATNEAMMSEEVRQMDDAGTGDDAESREAPAMPGETANGRTREELAAVRELALRAHPDTVPELVGGGTVAEIVASVAPARAAYQRIAAIAASPVVPAGTTPPIAIDPDRLPATEKIRRGLAVTRSSK